MKKLFFSVVLALCFVQVFAQPKTAADFNAKYLNWYNLDYANNQVMGASVDKAYAELLNGKPAKAVITVAVIDGGIDINHDDLKGRIWINKGELANNGVDDDGNGYIDDVNGWNFLGNAKGESILYETFEKTRVLREGAQNPDYDRAKEAYDKDLTEQLQRKDNLVKFEEAYLRSKEIIKKATGIEVHNAEDCAKVRSTNKQVVAACSFLMSRYTKGFTEASLERMKNRNNEYLTKYLNLEFNPRSLVGDNPADITDKKYGNGDVVGHRSSHGTCSAGIIAGIRGNGIGVEGVATDVAIMVLKVVPDGDERDKDVALAIRYAVDNGARIINMSFGKAFSPQRVYVEDAIRYAEQKNVLIVHSAGNEGKNIDDNMVYPTDVYNDDSYASNFICVGANGMVLNDSLPAVFSNYGTERVSLFAPGEDIVALDTNQSMDIHSGTSQAGPVVSGVAAVLLAHYPELTPSQVKKILLESVMDLKKQKVLAPNLEKPKRKSKKFGKLCASGGVVNLYKALQKAQQLSQQGML